MSRNSYPFALFTFAFVMMVGCTAAEVNHHEEQTEVSESSIINGQPAVNHEEAVFLNGRVWCSGSVIAPRVVLTAGHCVVASDSYEVHAPFAKNQVVRSSRVLNYDYVQNGNTVNTNKHDIGLVILEKEIKLSQYPKLSRGNRGAGTPIVTVGRMQNAQSRGQMYVSASHRINSASDWYYWADKTIESGDSGGPVVVAGSNPREIVGVNSGAGSNSELLARVDSLANWIDRVIADNGGPGQGGSGGGTAQLRIRSLHSGMFLDVSDVSKDRGAQVWQWSWWNGPNQKWTLESSGGNAARIASVHSGLCLDLWNSGTENGTKLVQWTCHDGANQKFRFRDMGDGSYAIIAAHSNKCLDVTGYGKTEGTAVQQWDCHYGANQRWVIERL